MKSLYNDSCTVHRLRFFWSGTGSDPMRHGKKLTIRPESGPHRTASHSHWKIVFTFGHLFKMSQNKDGSVPETQIITILKRVLQYCIHLLNHFIFKMKRLFSLKNCNKKLNISWKSFINLNQKTKQKFALFVFLKQSFHSIWKR